MEVVDVLKKGGIAIIPTDTIYGLVGQALDRKVVERIYRVKKRPPQKPFITLIQAVTDLKLFGLDISDDTKSVLDQVWPGKVSVVLHGVPIKFEYLTRGTGTLAFRLPDDDTLLQILKETGPLVAPSSNISDQSPAKDISEAKKYFGQNVDYYLDEGERFTSPSTLIELKGGEVNVLRQGDVEIDLK